MALSDIISADVSSVFLNGDFDLSIAYTPQGGTQRTIRAQILEDQDEIFEEGNDVEDFNKIQILVSAVDDVNGVTQPNEMGRGGAGDTAVFNGKTWYVRRILEDGKVSGTKMHHLLLTDKPIAMI